MRLDPLRQHSVFDVSDWEYDSEFGKFPQGARAKDAFFAPNVTTDSVLVGGKRYLFKRSRKVYADQFWTEVIAYRFGCLLGLEVPPAFAAFNSLTGHSGAIIEWFYIDGREAFQSGGDILQATVQKDIERKKGANHNLKSNTFLCRAMSQNHLLAQGWQQWWVDALLFDALIGNRDRHQDNWGFVASGPQTPLFRFAPLFDNGTSQGHELSLEKVQRWLVADFERYIRKGTHHLQWSLDDPPPRRGHSELLSLAFQEWPGTKETASMRLSPLEIEDFRLAIEDLPILKSPSDSFVHLSTARLDFLLKLIEMRLHNLKVLLS